MSQQNCATGSSVNKRTVPSVNRTLIIELNCEEIILNFQLISNYESYLPQFPKIFSFDFVEFSLTNFFWYSIALPNHLSAPLLNKDFPIVQIA
jgi:hypothetical protein